MARFLFSLISIFSFSLALDYHNSIDEGYTIVPGSYINIRTKGLKSLQFTLLSENDKDGHIFRIEYKCGEKPLLSWERGTEKGDNSEDFVNEYDCGGKEEVLISFASSDSVQVYQRRENSSQPWMTGLVGIKNNFENAKKYQLKGEVDQFTITFHRALSSELVEHVKENGLQTGDSLYIIFDINGRMVVPYEIRRGIKKTLMLKIEFKKLSDGLIGVNMINSKGDENRCFKHKDGLIRVLIQMRSREIAVTSGTSNERECISYFERVAPNDDPNFIQVNDGLLDNVLIGVDLLPVQIDRSN